jgi:hypothetical protein
MVFENVDIKHFSATTAGGSVHLDMLGDLLVEQKHHHFRVKASQYSPINVLITAEPQVTAFVELTTETGVIFLGGKLDVSNDVTVSPELIDVFDVNSSNDISN